MATLGCDRCNGTPPLPDQQNSPEAVQQRIVARIENLIQKENAGNLDKNLLDYFEWRLMEIYREAEAHHERIYKIKTNLLFEAMSKRTA